MMKSAELDKGFEKKDHFTCIHSPLLALCILANQNLFPDTNKHSVEIKES